MTRQSIALTVADMVKEAGIHIEVEGKSREEVQKLMYANPVLFGWGSHDPLETYNLYSSTKNGVGYYNAGQYSNLEVDAWMDKAMRATDEEEAWGSGRRRYGMEQQALAFKEMPLGHG